MRPWLLAIVLGIALFNAPPAQADVPQQIIDQIADLRVQETELKHLTAIGKLTGGDAVTKNQAIEAQIKTLWLPYRALPQAEDSSARTAIDRLVADKLALLRPQWTQEEAAFKAARDQHNKQLYAEAEDDARAAAELRRQRLVLQKELAAGTLARDAFDVQDKQASDAIAAFRKKYDDAGEEWPRWFDQRYRVMLEAALKNPDTPLSQPTVAAASPGAATAPPDFVADVQTAADLAVKREENAYKFDKKQIDQTLMANTDAVIDHDLAALKARYDALEPKRGAEFERAYLQAAAPRIQALKVQYYPPAVVSVPAAQENKPPITAPASPTVSVPVADAKPPPVAAPVPVAVEIPAYLKQMHEPDRVMTDIHGSDKLDTAARQAAALNRLSDVVMTLSGKADAPGGPKLTAEESRAYSRYRNASLDVSTAVYQSLDPDDKQRSDANSRRNQWNRLRDRYYNDEAFITALLQPYLTPDLKEKYLRGLRQTRQDIQTAQQHIQAHQDVVPTGQTDSSGDELRWLAEFGIGIGVLILAIWWWRGGLAKATKARSPGIRRTAYAIAALVLLAYLSHLFGQTIAAVIGAPVLGIWCLLRWGAAKAARRMRMNNQNAMSKFGATEDERSKNIDIIFDKRAADVEFDLNERGIRCHFFRSLSAMSPREREVLRTAYHLYNLGLFGGDTNFYLARFGLIYADGKATLTGNSKYPPQHYQVKFRTISDALKWYQGSNGLEAMINLTLNWLQIAITEANDDPILKKLSSRLHGDGGDLVPGAPLKSGAKGAPVEGGLILGLDEKAPGTWWYYDGEGSLITVAPPGSGKTQSQVFPNLLMWKGAAVVLDVKGEIYEQTSRWRRENVGPVYKFSPLDPATSHGYNPLTEVRADPDYLWEDARFLADMMIVPSGAKDPFWETRARDVLTAAIARVCLEANVAKRSMGDVLNILHGVGWDKFVTYLEARVDFASMTRAGHSLASMEPKTRDGVLQSALSSMSAWDGERIARATRKSDWSPLDLRGGTNPTIYICLKPNEVDSYISLLRVFIAQHIRSLTSTTVPAHGVHPILFMLDELPRLRHMPPVEEALETGRQYGIKLWLFAQSLGQLKNAYPNAEGMIGGCAIRMFMNPSLHDETAKKVSDDIGFVDSVIDATRVKIVEPNVLAGPDYKDVVIVMAANARAARLRKYFAYEDDALKARMGTARLAESLPA